MNGDPTYEELLEANRELKQQINSLKDVSKTGHRIKVKSSLLSSISHEIRTPMNAIMGFSDLLREKSLSDIDRANYIRYIRHSSHTLLNVMNNIIDLSLLEEREVTLREEDVQIEKLLFEVYENFNSQIVRTMEKKVVLLLTTPPGAKKLSVQVDPMYMNRLVDNILCNTITQQSGGVIEIKLEAPTDGWFKVSIISEYNEMLVERAKMVFESIECQDDWQSYMDVTGMAYKYARDLSKAMGGRVGLNLGNSEKVEICTILPVKGNNGKEKYRSEKASSKLMN